jgi:hypothetical protein
MSIRIARLSAAAALAFLLSATPATGLAYPISAPYVSSDTNPVRSPLDVLASENGSLWAAMDAIYSGSYIATACQQEPC